MSKFTLKASDYFTKKLAKILIKDRNLYAVFESKFILLSSDPLHPSLRSHKVKSRRFGVKYSSRITGDIRIIWGYGTTGIYVIDLYDVGTHKGRAGVY